MIKRGQLAANRMNKGLHSQSYEQKWSDRGQQIVNRMIGWYIHPGKQRVTRQ